MAYQWLTQDKIYVDWDLNPREKDMDHILALATHMNENGFDPKFPIIVYPLETGEGSYRAATGHHRLEASLLEDEAFPNLPLGEVYVHICEGSYQEYVHRMFKDNFQHTPGFNYRIGKMPTRAELKAMRQRLFCFPDVFEKSNSRLAKEWGCSDKTVKGERDDFLLGFPGSLQTVKHVHPEDIEKIQDIIEKDVYIGIDDKKRTRPTKVKEVSTSENSEVENEITEESESEPTPQSPAEKVETTLASPPSDEIQTVPLSEHQDEADWDRISNIVGSLVAETNKFDLSSRHKRAVRAIMFILINDFADVSIENKLYVLGEMMNDIMKKKTALENTGAGQ